RETFTKCAGLVGPGFVGPGLAGPGWLGLLGLWGLEQDTEKDALPLVAFRGDSSSRARQPFESFLTVAFSVRVTVRFPLPRTVKVLTALFEPSLRSQRYASVALP